MNTEVYDPDDRSDERLEPITVNYDPHEEEPPFETASFTKGGKPDRENGQSNYQKWGPPKSGPLQNPGFGDGVLLSYLGPKHPEVARRAIEEPLEPEFFTNDGSSPERSSRIKWERSDKTQERSLLPIPSRTEKPSTFHSLPSISESIFGKREPPPLPSKLSFGPRSPDDSLATSPLGKYTISPSQRPPQEQLPAFQSPPQSASGGSPENSQSLPSIFSALGDLTHPSPANALTPSSYAPFSPMTSSSSQGGRNNDHLAPINTLRPPPNPQDLPNSASRSSHWSPTKPKQPEKDYVGSPYDLSRKSPPAKDPAANAYPTPMEYKSAGAGDPDQTGLTPGNHSSPGSTAGGTYKCTHPGCTAAPFQTQYLLNSHANVHSQERPHFCPVPGCERGVGGKGFKRKNEMIRHGLVHNSPGYVCPFCPDQQHKYPRPDNLQRHVRVHHLDRGKDDPDLRKVLSQRPEGSNRGRRRRTHG